MFAFWDCPTHHVTCFTGATPSSQVPYTLQLNQPNCPNQVEKKRPMEPTGPTELTSDVRRRYARERVNGFRGKSGKPGLLHAFSHQEPRCPLDLSNSIWEERRWTVLAQHRISGHHLLHPAYACQWITCFHLS